VPTFTPDDARTLGGPSWLTERRLAAAERFAAASWPTTEEEIWRYSRIGELDLDAFRPGPLLTAIAGADGLLVDPDAAGDLSAR
jgi:Fe-S cluster assembly protein SufD